MPEVLEQDGLDSGDETVGTMPVTDGSDLESKFESRLRDMENRFNSRLDDERRRADYYQQMLESQTKTREPEIDPEEWVKGGDVERLMNKKLSEREEQEKLMRMELQQDAVRTKHDDYDDVIAKYLPMILREDPHQAHVIKASKNPPLTAYMLGRSHPEYKRQEQANTAKRVTDTIKENLSKPKTLSGIGGSEVKKDIDFKNMSDDDLEKMISDAKRRRS